MVTRPKLLRLSLWLAGFATALLVASCGDFLGKKTDLDFLGKPDYSNRPVDYLALEPQITGFENPTHLAAGFDQLLYVVDSLPNSAAGGPRCRIHAYDQAGNRIGTYTPADSILITHVEQDRTLDLIATGKVYRRIGQGERRVGFPAIFRIGLIQENGTQLGLQFATIKRTMLYPFFIREQLNRLNYVDSAYLLGINLRDIAILPGNRYIVACDSKFQTPQAIRSNYPNNSILLCQSIDTNWASIRVLCAGEGGDNYFRRPFGLVSFINPPQTQLNQSTADDFFFTSLEPTQTLKVQYIEVTPAAEGPSTYCIRNLTVGDTSKANGFLYTARRFTAPRAIALAGDASRALFVLDRDSLFQFTTEGLEGTAPPAGSGTNKPIVVSFGGTGAGPRQFNRPTSVAYLRQVVYVADAGNKRILRFKLSTNFE